MDALFWLVLAIAILALLVAWMMWGKAYGLQTDLDFAENEIAEAHRSIERQTAELRRWRPGRGEGGRFTGHG